MIVNGIAWRGARLASPVARCNKRKREGKLSLWQGNRSSCAEIVFNAEVPGLSLGTESLAAAVAAARTQPDQAAGVEAQFERVVETFAGDGFRYRRNVGTLVTAQARETDWPVRLPDRGHRAHTRRGGRDSRHR